FMSILRRRVVRRVVHVGDEDVVLKGNESIGFSTRARKAFQRMRTISNESLDEESSISKTDKEDLSSKDNSEIKIKEMEKFSVANSGGLKGSLDKNEKLAEKNKDENPAVFAAKTENENESKAGVETKVLTSKVIVPKAVTGGETKQPSPDCISAKIETGDDMKELSITCIEGKFNIVKVPQYELKDLFISRSCHQMNDTVCLPEPEQEEKYYTSDCEVPFQSTTSQLTPAEADNKASLGDEEEPAKGEEKLNFSEKLSGKDSKKARKHKKKKVSKGVTANSCRHFDQCCSNIMSMCDFIIKHSPKKDALKTLEVASHIMNYTFSDVSESSYSVASASNSIELSGEPLAIDDAEDDGMVLESVIDEQGNVLSLSLGSGEQDEIDGDNTNNSDTFESEEEVVPSVTSKSDANAKYAVNDQNANEYKINDQSSFIIPVVTVAENSVDSVEGKDMENGSEADLATLDVNDNIDYLQTIDEETEPSSFGDDECWAAEMKGSETALESSDDDIENRLDNIDTNVHGETDIKTDIIKDTLDKFDCNTFQTVKSRQLNTDSRDLDQNENNSLSIDPSHLTQEESITIEDTIPEYEICSTEFTQKMDCEPSYVSSAVDQNEQDLYLSHINLTNNLLSNAEPTTNSDNQLLVSNENLSSTLEMTDTFETSERDKLANTYDTLMGSFNMTIEKNGAVNMLQESPKTCRDVHDVSEEPVEPDNLTSQECIVIDDKPSIIESKVSVLPSELLDEDVRLKITHASAGGTEKVVLKNDFVREDTSTTCLDITLQFENNANDSEVPSLDSSVYYNMGSTSVASKSVLESKTLHMSLDSKKQEEETNNAQSSEAAKTSNTNVEYNILTHSVESICNDNSRISYAPLDSICNNQNIKVVEGTSDISFNHADGNGKSIIQKSIYEDDACSEIIEPVEKDGSEKYLLNDAYTYECSLTSILKEAYSSQNAGGVTETRTEVQPTSGELEKFSPVLDSDQLNTRDGKLKTDSPFHNIPTPGILTCSDNTTSLISLDAAPAISSHGEENADIAIPYALTNDELQEQNCIKEPCDSHVRDIANKQIHSGGSQESEWHSVSNVTSLFECKSIQEISRMQRKLPDEVEGSKSQVINETAQEQITSEKISTSEKYTSYTEPEEELKDVQNTGVTSFDKYTVQDTSTKPPHSVVKSIVDDFTKMSCVEKTPEKKVYCAPVIQPDMALLNQYRLHEGIEGDKIQEKKHKSSSPTLQSIRDRPVSPIRTNRLSYTTYVKPSMIVLDAEKRVSRLRSIFESSQKPPVRTHSRKSSRYIVQGDVVHHDSEDSNRDVHGDDDSQKDIASTSFENIGKNGTSSLTDKSSVEDSDEIISYQTVVAESSNHVTLGFNANTVAHRQLEADEKKMELVEDSSPDLMGNKVVEISHESTIEDSDGYNREKEKSGIISETKSKSSEELRGDRGTLVGLVETASENIKGESKEEMSCISPSKTSYEGSEGSSIEKKSRKLLSTLESMERGILQMQSRVDRSGDLCKISKHATSEDPTSDECRSQCDEIPYENDKENDNEYGLEKRGRKLVSTLENMEKGILEMQLSVQRLNEHYPVVSECTSEEAFIVEQAHTDAKLSRDSQLECPATTDKIDAFASSITCTSSTYLETSTDTINKSTKRLCDNLNEEVLNENTKEGIPVSYIAESSVQKEEAVDSLRTNKAFEEFLGSEFITESGNEDANASGRTQHEIKTSVSLELCMDVQQHSVFTHSALTENSPTIKDTTNPLVEEIFHNIIETTVKAEDDIQKEVSSSSNNLIMNDKVPLEVLHDTDTNIRLASEKELLYSGAWATEELNLQNNSIDNIGSEKLLIISVDNLGNAGKDKSQNITDNLGNAGVEESIIVANDNPENSEDIIIHDDSLADHREKESLFANAYSAIGGEEETVIIKDHNLGKADEEESLVDEDGNHGTAWEEESLIIKNYSLGCAKGDNSLSILDANIANAGKAESFIRTNENIENAEKLIITSDNNDYAEEEESLIDTDNYVNSCERPFLIMMNDNLGNSGQDESIINRDDNQGSAEDNDLLIITHDRLQNAGEEESQFIPHGNLGSVAEVDSLITDEKEDGSFDVGKIVCGNDGNIHFHSESRVISKKDGMRPKPAEEDLSERLFSCTGNELSSLISQQKSEPVVRLESVTTPNIVPILDSDEATAFRNACNLVKPLEEAASDPNLSAFEEINTQVVINKEVSSVDSSPTVTTLERCEATMAFDKIVVTEYVPASHSLEAESASYYLEAEPASQSLVAEPASHSQDVDPASHSQEAEPALHSVEDDSASDSLEAEPALHSLEAEPDSYSLEAEPALHTLEAKPASHSLDAKPALPPLEAEPASYSLEDESVSQSPEAEPALHFLEADPASHSLEAEPALHSQKGDPTSLKAEPASHFQEPEPAFDVIETDSIIFGENITNDELKHDLISHTQIKEETESSGIGSKIIDKKVLSASGVLEDVDGQKDHYHSQTDSDILLNTNQNVLISLRDFPRKIDISSCISAAESEESLVLTEAERELLTMLKSKINLSEAEKVSLKQLEVSKEGINKWLRSQDEITCDNAITELAQFSDNAVQYTIAVPDNALQGTENISDDADQSNEDINDGRIFSDVNTVKDVMCSKTNTPEVAVHITSNQHHNEVLGNFDDDDVSDADKKTTVMSQSCLLNINSVGSKTMLAINNSLDDLYNQPDIDSTPVKSGMNELNLYTSSDDCTEHSFGEIDKNKIIIEDHESFLKNIAEHMEEPSFDVDVSLDFMPLEKEELDKCRKSDIEDLLQIIEDEQKGVKDGDDAEQTDSGMNPSGNESSPCQENETWEDTNTVSKELDIINNEEKCIDKDVEEVQGISEKTENEDNFYLQLELNKGSSNVTVADEDDQSPSSSIQTSTYFSVPYENDADFVSFSQGTSSAPTSLLPELDFDEEKGVPNSQAISSGEGKVDAEIEEHRASPWALFTKIADFVRSRSASPLEQLNDESLEPALSSSDEEKTTLESALPNKSDLEKELDEDEVEKSVKVSGNDQQLNIPFVGGTIPLRNAIPPSSLLLGHISRPMTPTDISPFKEPYRPKVYEALSSPTHKEALESPVQQSTPKLSVYTLTVEDVTPEFEDASEFLTNENIMLKNQDAHELHGNPECTLPKDFLKDDQEKMGAGLDNTEIVFTGIILQDDLKLHSKKKYSSDEFSSRCRVIEESNRISIREVSKENDDVASLVTGSGLDYSALEVNSGDNITESESVDVTKTASLSSENILRYMENENTSDLNITKFNPDILKHDSSNIANVEMESATYYSENAQASCKNDNADDICSISNEEPRDICTTESIAGALVKSHMTDKDAELIDDSKDFDNKDVPNKESSGQRVTEGDNMLSHCEIFKSKQIYQEEEREGIQLSKDDDEISESNSLSQNDIESINKVVRDVICGKQNITSSEILCRVTTSPEHPQVILSSPVTHDLAAQESSCESDSDDDMRVGPIKGCSRPLEIPLSPSPNKSLTTDSDSQSESDVTTDEDEIEIPGSIPRAKFTRPAHSHSSKLHTIPELSEDENEEVLPARPPRLRKLSVGRRRLSDGRGPDSPRIQSYRPGLPSPKCMKNAPKYPVKGEHAYEISSMKIAEEGDDNVFGAEERSVGKDKSSVPLDSQSSSSDTDEYDSEPKVTYGRCYLVGTFKRPPTIDINEEKDRKIPQTTEEGYNRSCTSNTSDNIEYSLGTTAVEEDRKIPQTTEGGHTKIWLCDTADITEYSSGTTAPTTIENIAVDVMAKTTETKVTSEIGDSVSSEQCSSILFTKSSGSSVQFLDDSSEKSSFYPPMEKLILPTHSTYFDEKSPEFLQKKEWHTEGEQPVSLESTDVIVPLSPSLPKFVITPLGERSVLTQHAFAPPMERLFIPNIEITAKEADMKDQAHLFEISESVQNEGDRHLQNNDCIRDSDNQSQDIAAVTKTGDVQNIQEEDVPSEDKSNQQKPTIMISAIQKEVFLSEDASNQQELTAKTSYIQKNEFFCKDGSNPNEPICKISSIGEEKVLSKDPICQEEPSSNINDLQEKKFLTEGKSDQRNQQKNTTNINDIQKYELLSQDASNQQNRSAKISSAQMEAFLPEDVCNQQKQIETCTKTNMDFLEKGQIKSINNSPSTVVCQKQSYKCELIDGNEDVELLVEVTENEISPSKALNENLDRHNTSFEVGLVQDPEFLTDCQNNDGTSIDEVGFDNSAPEGAPENQNGITERVYDGHHVKIIEDTIDNDSTVSLSGDHLAFFQSGGLQRLASSFAVVETGEDQVVEGEVNDTFNVTATSDPFSSQKDSDLYALDFPCNSSCKAVDIDVSYSISNTSQASEDGERSHTMSGSDETSLDWKEKEEKLERPDFLDRASVFPQPLCKELIGVIYEDPYPKNTEFLIEKNDVISPILDDESSCNSLREDMAANFIKSSCDRYEYPDQEMSFGNPGNEVEYKCQNQGLPSKSASETCKIVTECLYGKPVSENSVTVLDSSCEKVDTGIKFSCKKQSTSLQSVFENSNTALISDCENSGITLQATNENPEIKLKVAHTAPDMESEVECEKSEFLSESISSMNSESSSVRKDEMELSSHSISEEDETKCTSFQNIKYETSKLQTQFSENKPNMNLSQGFLMELECNLNTATDDINIICSTPTDDLASGKQSVSMEFQTITNNEMLGNSVYKQFLFNASNEASSPDVLLEELVLVGNENEKTHVDEGYSASSSNQESAKPTVDLLDGDIEFSLTDIPVQQNNTLNISDPVHTGELLTENEPITLDLVCLEENEPCSSQNEISKVYNLLDDDITCQPSPIILIPDLELVDCFDNCEKIKDGTMEETCCLQDLLSGDLTCDFVHAETLISYSDDHKSEENFLRTGDIFSPEIERNVITDKEIFVDSSDDLMSSFIKHPDSETCEVFVDTYDLKRSKEEREYVSRSIEALGSQNLVCSRSQQSRGVNTEIDPDLTVIVTKQNEEEKGNFSHIEKIDVTQDYKSQCTLQKENGSKCPFQVNSESRTETYTISGDQNFDNACFITYIDSTPLTSSIKDSGVFEADLKLQSFLSDCNYSQALSQDSDLIAEGDKKTWKDIETYINDGESKKLKSDSDQKSSDSESCSLMVTAMEVEPEQDDSQCLNDSLQDKDNTLSEISSTVFESLKDIYPPLDSALSLKVSALEGTPDFFSESCESFDQARYGGNVSWPDDAPTITTRYILDNKKNLSSESFEQANIILGEFQQMLDQEGSITSSISEPENDMNDDEVANENAPLGFIVQSVNQQTSVVNENSPKADARYEDSQKHVSAISSTEIVSSQKQCWNSLIAGSGARKHSCSLDSTDILSKPRGPEENNGDTYYDVDLESNLSHGAEVHDSTKPDKPFVGLVSRMKKTWTSWFSNAPNDILEQTGDKDANDMPESDTEQSIIQIGDDVWQTLHNPTDTKPERVLKSKVRAQKKKEKAAKQEGSYVRYEFSGCEEAQDLYVPKGAVSDEKMRWEVSLAESNSQSDYHLWKKAKSANGVSRPPKKQDCSQSENNNDGEDDAREEDIVTVLHKPSEMSVNDTRMENKEERASSNIKEAEGTNESITYSSAMEEGNKDKLMNSKKEEKDTVSAYHRTEEDDGYISSSFKSDVKTLKKYSLSCQEAENMNKICTPGSCTEIHMIKNITSSDTRLHSNEERVASVEDDSQNLKENIASGETGVEINTQESIIMANIAESGENIDRSQVVTKAQNETMVCKVKCEAKELMDDKIEAEDDTVPCIERRYPSIKNIESGIVHHRKHLWEVPFSNEEEGEKHREHVEGCESLKEDDEEAVDVQSPRPKPLTNYQLSVKIKSGSVLHTKLKWEQKQEEAIQSPERVEQILTPGKLEGHECSSESLANLERNPSLKNIEKGFVQTRKSQWEGNLPIMEEQELDDVHEGKEKILEAASPDVSYKETSETKCSELPSVSKPVEGYQLSVKIKSGTVLDAKLLWELKEIKTKGIDEEDISVLEKNKTILKSGATSVQENVSHTITSHKYNANNEAFDTEKKEESRNFPSEAFDISKLGEESSIEVIRSSDQLSEHVIELGLVQSKKEMWKNFSKNEKEILPVERDPLPANKKMLHPENNAENCHENVSILGESLSLSCKYGKTNATEDVWTHEKITNTSEQIENLIQGINNTDFPDDYLKFDKGIVKAGTELWEKKAATLEYDKFSTIGDKTFCEQVVTEIRNNRHEDITCNKVDSVSLVTDEKPRAVSSTNNLSIRIKPGTVVDAKLRWETQEATDPCPKEPADKADQIIKEINKVAEEERDMLKDTSMDTSICEEPTASLIYADHLNISPVKPAARKCVKKSLKRWAVVEFDDEYTLCNKNLDAHPRDGLEESPLHDHSSLGHSQWFEPEHTELSEPVSAVHLETGAVDGTEYMECHKNSDAELYLKSTDSVLQPATCTMSKVADLKDNNSVHICKNYDLLNDLDFYNMSKYVAKDQDGSTFSETESFPRIKYENVGEYTVSDSSQRHNYNSTLKIWEDKIIPVNLSEWKLQKKLVLSEQNADLGSKIKPKKSVNFQPNKSFQLATEKKGSTMENSSRIPSIEIVAGSVARSCNLWENVETVTSRSNLETKYVLDTNEDTTEGKEICKINKEFTSPISKNIDDINCLAVKPHMDTRADAYSKLSTVKISLNNKSTEQFSDMSVPFPAKNLDRHVDIKKKAFYEAMLSAETLSSIASGNHSMDSFYSKADGLRTVEINMNTSDMEAKSCSVSCIHQEDDGIENINNSVEDLHEQVTNDLEAITLKGQVNDISSNDLSTEENKFDDLITADNHVKGMVELKKEYWNEKIKNDNNKNLYPQKPLLQATVDNHTDISNHCEGLEDISVVSETSNCTSGSIPPALPSTTPPDMKSEKYMLDVIPSDALQPANSLSPDCLPGTPEFKLPVSDTLENTNILMNNASKDDKLDHDDVEGKKDDVMTETKMKKSMVLQKTDFWNKKITKEVAAAALEKSTLQKSYLVCKTQDEKMHRAGDVYESPDTLHIVTNDMPPVLPENVDKTLTEEGILKGLVSHIKGLWDTMLVGEAEECAEENRLRIQNHKSEHSSLMHDDANTKENDIKDKDSICTVAPKLLSDPNVEKKCEAILKSNVEEDKTNIYCSDHPVSLVAQKKGYWDDFIAKKEQGLPRGHKKDSKKIHNQKHSKVKGKLTDEETVSSQNLTGTCINAYGDVETRTTCGRKLSIIIKRGTVRATHQLFENKTEDDYKTWKKGRTINVQKRGIIRHPNNSPANRRVEKVHVTRYLKKSSKTKTSRDTVSSFTPSSKDHCESSTSEDEQPARLKRKTSFKIQKGTVQHYKTQWEKTSDSTGFWTWKRQHSKNIRPIILSPVHIRSSTKCERKKCTRITSTQFDNHLSPQRIPVIPMENHIMGAFEGRSFWEKERYRTPTPPLSTPERPLTPEEADEYLQGFKGKVALARKRFDSLGSAISTGSIGSLENLDTTIDSESATIEPVYSKSVQETYINEYYAKALMGKVSKHKSMWERKCIANQQKAGRLFKRDHQQKTSPLENKNSTSPQGTLTQNVATKEKLDDIKVSVNKTERKCLVYILHNTIDGDLVFETVNDQYINDLKADRGTTPEVALSYSNVKSIKEKMFVPHARVEQRPKPAIRKKKAGVRGAQTM
ncbi:hypothetical protein SK128_025020, partial [Halocaridina rubra]